MLSAVFICLLFGTTFAVQSGQTWNYTIVRPAAHMFWWLHYTTANVAEATDRPLIIWLQGGPGASSTGFGNFGEIGALDVDLKPRNTTWVQYANILYVDNPVGTGFSYVDYESAYTTNNSQIAKDFLEFLKDFYVIHPEFIPIPLYIFSESYGGKMTVEIALTIDKAKKLGEINTNLKGIVLGDSWISPIDFVMTWAPYLLNLGIVDEDGYKEILDIANKCKDALDQGDYDSATDYWSFAESTVVYLTHADFYNVLYKKQGYESPLSSNFSVHDIDPDMESKLTDLMNNKIKQELGLRRSWQNLNQNVFNALYDDFMIPVTNIVEELLNTTDIQITVYNGQLDLIVDTPGTVKWVYDLNFKGKKEWNEATRTGFVSDGNYEGYVKKQGNLALYWIDRSGHYAPLDNPSGMYYILKEVTNNFVV